MIIIIKNKSPGVRSYIGGLITVLEDGITIVPREFNVLLFNDNQLLCDIGLVSTAKIIINNGIKDLNVGEVLDLAKVFSQFSLNPIATIPIYYSLPINIKHTGTVALDSTIFSMINNTDSLKIIMIERINLQMCFSAATPLIRTDLIYELVRFNTATPTGGTSISPVLMDSNALTSAITDARYSNTGLTVTGVVFETPFSYIGCPTSDGASTTYFRDIPIKLAAGEGLAIKLTLASVAGQGLSGEIIWSER